MTERRSRAGIFSLVSGLLSAGLFLIVAAGALELPAQAPPGLVIAAGVMMLALVLSGLIAVIAGLIGLFRPGKKAPAVAGALLGGAAVGLLLLLAVIGQRVGGAGPVPGPPALRSQTK